MKTWIPEIEKDGDKFWFYRCDVQYDEQEFILFRNIDKIAEIRFFVNMNDHKKVKIITGFRNDGHYESRLGCCWLTFGERMTVDTILSGVELSEYRLPSIWVEAINALLDNYQWMQGVPEPTN